MVGDVAFNAIDGNNCRTWKRIEIGWLLPLRDVTRTRREAASRARAGSKDVDLCCAQRQLHDSEGNKSVTTCFLDIILTVAGSPDAVVAIVW